VKERVFTGRIGFDGLCALGLMLIPLNAPVACVTGYVFVDYADFSEDVSVVAILSAMDRWD